MKEKKDCKIIQDLLPNYIENLTNEETNIFIEEHLKECDDCKKILDNMKKDLNISTSKRNSKEVNYIKKYNSKLKLLRNLLILIIVVTVIVIGRKTFILNNLSNKAEQIKNSKNYYLKLESYSAGQMTITEAYYKDEKSIITISTYSQGIGVAKQTFYKAGEEKIALFDTGETKSITNMDIGAVQPISFTSDNFFTNLYTSMTTNIDKVNLNGKECYIIKEGDTEKFIDINTGLAIKMIDNQNNRTIDYKYEYGIVKDSDIVKPDTTGYTLNE